MLKCQQVLTFMRRINTTSERLKARNFFFRQYFSFYEHLKFRAQLSFITTSPVSSDISKQWDMTASTANDGNSNEIKRRQ